MGELDDIMALINLDYQIQYCTLMPLPECVGIKYFNYEIQLFRRKENGLRDSIRLNLNTFKAIGEQVDFIIKSQNAKCEAFKLAK